MKTPLISQMRYSQADQTPHSHYHLSCEMVFVSAGAAEFVIDGKSYVAEEKGIILGTAVISFEKEKTYDGIENGQWLTPGDTKYMVIHRIATNYEYKRRGTAGAFLEFARETARRRGVLSIRIDTHPDNQIMQSWLCKNGFIYCGWIWLINGSLRYAYENVL